MYKIEQREQLVDLIIGEYLISNIQSLESKKKQALIGGIITGVITMVVAGSGSEQTPIVGGVLSAIYSAARENGQNITPQGLTNIAKYYLIWQVYGRAMDAIGLFEASMRVGNLRERVNLILSLPKQSHYSSDERRRPPF